MLLVAQVEEVVGSNNHWRLVRVVDWERERESGAWNDGKEINTVNDLNP